MFLFLLSKILSELDWGLGIDNPRPKNIDWENAKTYDVIIIGSGPAGNSAALYAARSGLSVLVLHGYVPGGQLTKTTKIENYPGFRGNATNLIDIMQEQAQEAGAKYHFDIVSKVNLKSNPKTVETQTNIGYKSKTIIIATGATPKLLGVKNEQKFLANGVSTCAMCDGPIYQDLTVAVVGGGDSAVEQALYLSKICSSVSIIHRGSSLRASLPLRRKLENITNVRVIYNTIVESIAGNEFFEGLEVRHAKTKETATFCCHGVFISIGTKPQTDLFKGQVKMDKDGFIVTNGKPTTDVPGVFAAGDCADREFRQAITSAGTGAQAAMLAEQYINSL